MTNDWSEMEQSLTQMSDITSNPSLQMPCWAGLHRHGNKLPIISQTLKDIVIGFDADSGTKSEPVML